MDIYQFILQLFSVAVVPLFLAMLNQNKKMTSLQSQLSELQKDYNDLTARFNALQTEHRELQAEYKESLKKQAGIRETF